MVVAILVVVLVVILVLTGWLRQQVVREAGMHVVSPEGHDQLAPEAGPIHETVRLVHVVQQAQGGGWHWQQVEAQWVEQLQATCWQQVEWLWRQPQQHEHQCQVSLT